MNKKMKIFLVCAVLAATLILAASVPGTNQDPLVSRSLLERELNTIRDYFNARINALNVPQPTPAPTPTPPAATPAPTPAPPPVLDPAELALLQASIREQVKTDLRTEIEQLRNELRQPNEQLYQIKNELEQLRQELESVSAAPVSQVVEAHAGQIIIGHEGTRLILRGGTADVYSLAENGLADLTAGTELLHGTAAPLNHLLLVSRGDGRGLTITSDIAWVLVEGGFY